MTLETRIAELERLVRSLLIKVSGLTIDTHTVDHGALTGLTDDDHTQYLRADGTRALTADWDAGNVEIRARTLESDVTMGTPPLTVASATKVTNLNADYLDDMDSSSFASINIHVNSKEPTGFVDRTSSTLSFVDATRVFTIAPAVSNFAFYSAGTLYTKTSQTATIDDTEGMHYIYFDTSGVLQKSMTAWDINSDNVPVATVYWDGSAGLVMDKRHGIQMDGQTQEYLRRTAGIAYANGLAGSFHASGSSITIGAGMYYDGDIEYDIAAQTQCRIFYLDGSTWKWTSAQNAYFHAVSSVPQYNNSGALANVDTSKYSISWVYVTNLVSTPVAVIMGQGQYDTQSQAEAASVPSLASLPADGMLLLYKVIWQRNGSIISWKRTDDYRRVNGDTSEEHVPLDHGALAGLSDDDHAQYLRADATRGVSADWDIGDYELRAKTLEADVATGTPPLTVASTTVVTNLNADTVDGSHASAFAVAAKGVTNGDTHDHAGGDGAQIDHGGLAGLGDDDHTQYLKADATRALSADWDAGDVEIRARTLESDVATGTAPLTVASTTAVSNLNADLLDGNHAAAFAVAAKGVTNGDSHDHSGGDGAQIDHGGLAGLTDADHPATAITVSVTNFDGNLSAADDTVQKALDTIDDLNLTASDADAIHDNVSGEISAVTEKAMPVGDDLLLIEDSAASNAKKRVKISNALRYVIPEVTDGITLYVNGGTGSDSNDGSSGSPLATIQEAVDRFAGKVVKNCVINVAAGTYQENLQVSGYSAAMFNGLSIIGDTGKEMLGYSFIHGDSTAFGFTYEGSGAITLTSDNGGAGGRWRITVTRATTNPNFASDGIDTTNYVRIWDGSTLYDYQIYSVSSNVITLATTAAAAALNTNGRFMVVLPNVRLTDDGSSEACAVEVYGTGVQLQGLYCKGTYCGIRLWQASVATDTCVFEHTTTSSYYAAVHPTPNSVFYARSTPQIDAPITAIGYYAALTAPYNAYCNTGWMSLLGRGTYGIWCAGGKIYFNFGRVAVGTPTGVYSANSGYVFAGSVNAKNWATTKFSPSATNTIGNNAAYITFT